MRSSAVFIAFLTLTLFGGGCMTGSDQVTHVSPSIPITTVTQTPTPPSSASSTPPQTTATLPNPVSLPALFQKPLQGSDFRLGNILAQNEIYTRYYITYKSGELTISGIMNVPKGAGPFPVLVLNHGHIDTSVYTNGRGLRREQDYLTRAGFIVIHPDYRNHAQSSKDPRDEVIVRLGYVEDVLNAIDAVKNAHLPYADMTRVGMLGHSMGGGITLAAITAHPELIQAAVLYAPVSGDLAKSYERWMSRRPESAKRIQETYGDPTEAPEFWRNISTETFYDRITTPVHIFHGTADKDVPLEWSEKTRDLLYTKGKRVELTVYPNAPHEFSTNWIDFMKNTKYFFDKEL